MEGRQMVMVLSPNKKPKPKQKEKEKAVDELESKEEVEKVVV
jgi:hypothetical protein